MTTGTFLTCPPHALDSGADLSGNSPVGERRCLLGRAQHVYLELEVVIMI